VQSATPEFSGQPSSWLSCAWSSLTTVCQCWTFVLAAAMTAGDDGPDEQAAPRRTTMTTETLTCACRILIRSGHATVRVTFSAPTGPTFELRLTCWLQAIRVDDAIRPNVWTLHDALLAAPSALVIPQVVTDDDLKLSIHQGTGVLHVEAEVVTSI
jgi:hypothetical protein